ncbi:hypothetical protein QFC19_005503 [Naganishia cerealis]|uniref:Uncharacterized protein n=1 Tax=Naganishia cerealis TaxID=610337 RepID=A0ACC2VMW4_9TREE|nr:hypothetical protein QFC19_005503 [Naganishia cerealis]
MLHTKGIEKVRTWPRGVDLPQLYPVGRCEDLRRRWGIEPVSKLVHIERTAIGKASMGNHSMPMEMPLTPPMTPVTDPADSRDYPASNSTRDKPERLVALFVSRMSWEKNLLLLIKALTLLPDHLPLDAEAPKMVFVGDGPAKAEIERVCQEKGIDAVFMGYQEKEGLARAYASADFFCFPSFTEVREGILDAKKAMSDVSRNIRRLSAK